MLVGGGKGPAPGGRTCPVGIEPAGFAGIGEIVWNEEGRPTLEGLRVAGAF